jgi:hypothetical protein
MEFNEKLNKTIRGVRPSKPRWKMKLSERAGCGDYTTRRLVPSKLSLFSRVDNNDYGVMTRRGVSYCTTKESTTTAPVERVRVPWRFIKTSSLCHWRKRKRLSKQNSRGRSQSRKSTSSLSTCFASESCKQLVLMERKKIS